jgi:high-affinity iron transporter
MLDSLLLAFRESFEAVLILGVIFTQLDKSGRNKMKNFVIFGAVAGLSASIMGGLVIVLGARDLNPAKEALLHGVMLISAALLIAYFIGWMAIHPVNQSSSIKTTIDETASGFGIAILAFFAVFREGLELLVFTMTKINENASNLALPTIAGIALAIGLGYLFFKSSLKLNVKWIFKVLGLLLIFIGATMLQEGLMVFWPNTSALILTGSQVLYIVVTLGLFLKDDLIHLLKH